MTNETSPVISIPPINPFMSVIWICHECGKRYWCDLPTTPPLPCQNCGSMIFVRPATGRN